jgi:hypothetical protein
MATNIWEKPSVLVFNIVLQELVHIWSLLQLLVTTNVPSPLLFFTLMMEVIRSSETSVLRRATERHISEDSILHLHQSCSLTHAALLNFLRETFIHTYFALDTVGTLDPILSIFTGTNYVGRHKSLRHQHDILLRNKLESIPATVQHRFYQAATSLTVAHYSRLHGRLRVTEDGGELRSFEWSDAGLS